jgi:hypothetical protein
MNSDNDVNQIIEESLENSKDFVPSNPLPLGEKLERLSFPVNALSEDFRTVLLALHKITQAPLELCFAALFSVMNHAVQALVNIRLPQGQIKPASCFFISVADSGERKTAADDLALQATKDYQDILLDNYILQKKSYRKSRAIYESEKQRILRDKGYNQEQKKAKLDKLIEPEEPLYPILITGDPTMEGLIKLFHAGFPFVILSSSEGGMFFGGYANNKDNHLKTLTKMSRLWDGGEIDQVRKESELLLLKDRRLNIHLSVQPIAFKEFIDKGYAGGQGFLARVLLASPKPLAGTRDWLRPEDTHESFEVLKIFTEKVRKLYDSIRFVDGDPASGLDLKNIGCLSDESLALLKEFYEYGEQRLGLCGQFYDVKDFVSKSQENVLRLATTLTLYENPHASVISVEAVKTAIQLILFYISEQLFIRASDGDSDEEKLLTWLYAKYPEGIFERATLLKVGLKPFRTASVLDPLLKRLEELGYIVSSGKGTFRIVPLTLGKKAKE